MHIQGFARYCLRLIRLGFHRFHEVYAARQWHCLPSFKLSNHLYPRFPGIC
nr:MAG TPA: hypothetical protein [Caudoviricetes sp.]